jgi:hypothetical protein
LEANSVTDDLKLKVKLLRKWEKDLVFRRSVHGSNQKTSTTSLSVHSQSPIRRSA